MVDRAFFRPEVEAHQGLYALANAGHGHEDQGVDVADDGIWSQAALTDDSEDNVVKKEDDQAVGELIESL